MLELAGPLAVAALVLAAGGAFKLRDPGPTSDMFAAVGLRGRGARRLLAVASGLVELALGIATLLVGGWLLALATASAFTVFALLALRMVRTGSTASCGCFGRHSGRTTGLHVAIDVAVAVVALGAGIADAPGFLDVRDELPGGGLVFAGLAALGAWLVVAALTVLPDALDAARRTPRVPSVRTFEIRGQR
jgi:hypothetical protein